MALTQTILQLYRQEQPRQQKWSWAHAAWFIFLTCGAFWTGAIALVWRFF